MKNRNSRNGIMFFLILIVTIAGYLVIRFYGKAFENDVYNENTIYENNRKKQPINNIIAIKPNPTITPGPTIEPTIEPIIKPTSSPVKPTPTHGGNQEEINKNIFFEYDYNEGNYIYLINQFPLKDEIGKSLQGDKRTQDFKLKFNEAAVGVKYTITAEKMDSSTFDDEWVKLFLVADGGDIKNCYRSNNRVKTFNEYSKYNGSSKEKIIYEGVISSAEASRGYKDFTFRMWVSEDLELYNSDYLSESKTYKVKINVYAKDE